MVPSIAERIFAEERPTLTSPRKYWGGYTFWYRADNGTRALLETILKDEEGHVDWLEAQLGMIKEIGVENYLARQME